MEAEVPVDLSCIW